MTVQELYDYAKDNNLLDADIYVRDFYGSWGCSQEIEIKNREGYTAIGLS